MIVQHYKDMLGAKSVIREISEWSAARGREIGYENVFDYSLGNPSVPCPPQFTAACRDLLCNTGPLALPGYTTGEFDRTLSLLKNGGCTHISAYLLKIEPGTAFYKNPPADLPVSALLRRIFQNLLLKLLAVVRVQLQIHYIVQSKMHNSK